MLKAIGIVCDHDYVRPHLISDFKIHEVITPLVHINCNSELKCT